MRKQDLAKGDRQICDGRGVPLAVRSTERTGTTCKGRCRSSMRFRRCEANEGDTAVVPTASSATARINAEIIRHGLRTRYILALLAVLRHEHGSGLGQWRWVVERTFA